MLHAMFIKTKKRGRCCCSILLIALTLMLYGCGKPGVSGTVSEGNREGENLPLFPALSRVDAASFDTIRIAEADEITYLTSDAFLPDSVDGNLGVLSGKAMDEKAILFLGDAAVGRLPDELPDLFGTHGIHMAGPEFLPDRAITSAAFENAGESGAGYCHLRLFCGLVDMIYVIFQNAGMEYVPRYVLVNDCEREEGFSYTGFCGMDWAVYRSSSEDGTGVSETTISWLNLSKGKHELVYAEYRTEQGSFTGQTCPSETIESALRSMESDCLHIEVAMRLTSSSGNTVLRCTERKTDLTIYYDTETSGFYIKLPREAYPILPLQLDPVRLQEYLLMFEK